MIRSIWLSDEGSGNADVIAELEDGRKYAFTAFTPEDLARQMRAEGVGHFVVPDLLVVREVSQANVRAAVEEILAEGDIERAGLRQAG